MQTVLYLYQVTGEHTFDREGGENMGVVEKTVIYPNLRAEKARRGDTLETLGEVLGLSPPSLTRRLSGEIAWTKPEIDILCKRYNVPYEILFKRE